MRVLILFSAAIAVLPAQTMVESSAITSGTSGAAAGAGKTIGGVFKNLDKTLKTDKPAASETVVVRDGGKAAKNTPAAPAKTYEDIKLAEVGMEYDELVRRFGPAALEAGATGGGKTLTYSGKAGSTRIEVKDGKVSAITATAVKPQSAVFTLPK